MDCTQSAQESYTVPGLPRLEVSLDLARVSCPEDTLQELHIKTHSYQPVIHIRVQSTSRKPRVWFLLLGRKIVHDKRSKYTHYEAILNLG